MLGLLALAAHGFSPSRGPIHGVHVSRPMSADIFEKDSSAISASYSSSGSSGEGPSKLQALLGSRSRGSKSPGVVAPPVVSAEEAKWYADHWTEVLNLELTRAAEDAEEQRRSWSTERLASEGLVVFNLKAQPSGEVCGLWATMRRRQII